MKIERIAPNKIKITLSIEDLKEWDINFENLTHNSPEAQELFWNLIRRAETEAGFSAEGSQLVVEAMPIKNDGFVMIITKVEEDDNNAQRYIRPKIKRDVRPKKRVRIVSNPLIFQFENLEDVISACKSIKSRFTGESTLYKHKDSYYLMLNILNDFVAEDIDVMLADFAQKETYGVALKAGELAEHGLLLIENNTVGTMCTHF